MNTAVVPVPVTLDAEVKKAIVSALFSHRHSLSQTVALLNSRGVDVTPAEGVLAKIRAQLLANEKALNLLVEGAWQ